MEGSGASRHLQMVPSSRTNVLFSLRFRGFCSSGACGLLLTYPPHAFTNSVKILKEIAVLGPVPSRPQGSLEGLDGSCSSCSLWPPFSQPGRCFQAARASGLGSKPRVPGGQVLLVQRPRHNQTLRRAQPGGDLSAQTSFHQGLRAPGLGGRGPGVEAAQPHVPLGPAGLSLGPCLCG